MGRYRGSRSEEVKKQLEKYYKLLSQVSGTNINKYEKLLHSFTTKKLRQTKSKEYQFKCQLDSYKKKPTVGKLNSIENNYNAIMRKNKNK